MDYKNTDAALTTVTYDKVRIEEPTENIYQSIAIMAKRASQISEDLKRELVDKLEEFATHNDSLEEVFENKEQVIEVVGMFQKEVAERIASPPGSKKYGILSVLLQAFYDIEYLFNVEPNVFIPPPKVRSAVIRLKRNNVQDLGCDEKLFKRVIKQAFQMRRKTLRNALQPLTLPENIIELDVFNKRAEQLSVSDFVDLTNKIYR